MLNKFHVDLKNQIAIIETKTHSHSMRGATRYSKFIIDLADLPRAQEISGSWGSTPSHHRRPGAIQTTLKRPRFLGSLKMKTTSTTLVRWLLHCEDQGADVKVITGPGGEDDCRRSNIIFSKRTKFKGKDSRVPSVSGVDWVNDPGAWRARGVEGGRVVELGVFAEKENAERAVRWWEEDKIATKTAT